MGKFEYGENDLFTDSRGKPLFYLPDGEILRLDDDSGEHSCALCRYINEEQVEMDGRCLNIRQFAKQMERNGIRYRSMNETKGKGDTSYDKISCDE